MGLALLLIGRIQSRFGVFAKGFRVGIGAAVQQDFHLLLGRFQGALALTRQRDTPLEGFQSIIQRQVTLFKTLHQGFKFSQRGLKIHRNFIPRDSGG